MSDFDKWWGNDEPEKELIEFRQFKNTAQEAWAEGYKAGQQSQQPSAESPTFDSDDIEYGVLLGAYESAYALLRSLDNINMDLLDLPVPPSQQLTEGGVMSERVIDDYCTVSRDGTIRMDMGKASKDPDFVASINRLAQQPQPEPKKGLCMWHGEHTKESCPQCWPTEQSQQPSAESPISKIELSMWLEELEEQVDDAVAGDCPHTEYSARVRLATIKQLTEGD